MWLCHHPDPWVRAQAARACADADSDAGVLCYLAADQDARVRAAVAGNSHTAREVLTEMAEDADADVRRALAGNTATPATLLGALVVGTTSTARIVVYRKDTPPQVLLTLTEHADGDIRALAVARTPLDSTLAHQFARPESRGEVWVALARNPATPTEVRRSLLDQILAGPVGPRVDLDDYRVLLGIAEHPNAMTAQLQRLVELTDRGLSSESLDACLAENPQTPPALLHRLARSKTPRVRAAARTTLHGLQVAPSEYRDAFTARRHDQPMALLRFAERYPAPSEEPREVLDSPVGIRTWAAAGRSPYYLLAALAADPDATVRGYVAENRATPPHVLHSLATDPVEKVRKAVAGNLATDRVDLVEMARTDDSLDVVALIKARQQVPPGSVLAAALAERAAQYPPCYLAGSAWPPARPPATDAADHQAMTDPRRSFTERLDAARRSQQPRGDSKWGRLRHYTTCLVPVFTELLAGTTRPAVVQGILDAVREEIDETSWIRAMGQWCEDPTAGESLEQLDQAAGRNRTLDMATLWDQPSHTLWHETEKVLRGAMRACPRGRSDRTGESPADRPDVTEPDDEVTTGHR